MVAPGDDVLASQHSGTRYYSIGPGSFVVYDTGAWLTASYINIQSASNTVSVGILATVNLPNGAIITSFKTFWERTDASASGICRLIECIFNGAVTEMAAADSDSSGGNHVVEDTSIANATINNSTKRYVVLAIIDPNASFNDVRFRGCMITYTVAVPLP